jgi:glycine betaine/proline transport system substrate-binding protein
MKNLKIKAIVAILTTAMVFVSGQALAKDSRKPIVIPTHNWSSQVVMAYVIGGIFEKLGNRVKYVPADSQAVYEAIRNGDVTISHEVWQSTFGKSFYNAMAKGGLIDAGNHSALTIEELGVPSYVIEKNLCPGLPDWKALADCHKVFATADSGGKGRILEGPQSWHGDLMPKRIKALGLEDKYVVKFAGSADAIWAELAFDGCRIEDGGDGSCGSPVGWLKKAANYKFPKTHPRAYTVFSKISFSTQDIGQMASLVDVFKLSHEDAAKSWLNTHEDVWKPFLE